MLVIAAYLVGLPAPRGGDLAAAALPGPGHGRDVAAGERLRVGAARRDPRAAPLGRGGDGERRAGPAGGGGRRAGRGGHDGPVRGACCGPASPLLAVVSLVAVAGRHLGGSTLGVLAGLGYAGSAVSVRGVGTPGGGRRGRLGAGGADVQPVRVLALLARDAARRGLLGHGGADRAADVRAGGDRRGVPRRRRAAGLVAGRAGRAGARDRGAIALSLRSPGSSATVSSPGPAPPRPPEPRRSP